MRERGIVGTRRPAWRAAGAIIVAYALFFQAIVGALVIGVGAAEAGGLGTFVCSPRTAEAAAANAEPGGRNWVPSCCLQGCGMFAVPVLPVPPSVALPVEPLHPASVPSAPVGRLGDRAVAPGNPRAPPLTV